MTTEQKQSLVISFLIGFAILIGLDQWTKGLAAQSLKEQKPPVIWDGVLEFYYSESGGATFGTMQEKQLFFPLIAVLVLGTVIYLIWRIPPEGGYRPLAVCLTMANAGTVGSTIDRVSQGYVVNSLYFKLINLPIFNVADYHVTMGTVCLVFLIMFYYKDEDMAYFSFRKH